MAMLLRAKIFPEIKDFKTGINIWNTELATHEKQYLREDYEDKLVAFLRAELIRDWGHLKEVAENL